MSGSPVYVGDQLVGAISYGYSLSDHRIGFVTPIRDMLDVLDMLQPDAAARSRRAFRWPGNRPRRSGSRSRGAGRGDSRA